MNIKLVPGWQDILTTRIEDASISNDDFLRIYRRVLSKWGDVLDAALANDHTALRSTGSACAFCNLANDCADCVVSMLTGETCEQLFEIIRQQHVWALKDREEKAIAAARVLGALAYFYGQVVEALTEEG